jgi:hypothetical protein
MAQLEVTQSMAPRNHEKLYFNDGDLFFLVRLFCLSAECHTYAVVFQVENHYFCVHRSVFERESNILGRLTGDQAKGRSEASALVLNDVQLIDFERFLAALYNP